MDLLGFWGWGWPWTVALAVYAIVPTVVGFRNRRWRDRQPEDDDD
jgi:hypothetical protein